MENQSWEELEEVRDRYEDEYPEFMERAREWAKFLCRHNYSAKMLKPEGVYQNVVTIDMVRIAMDIKSDPHNKTNLRHGAIFRPSKGWKRETWITSMNPDCNGRPVAVWRYAA